MPVAAAGRGRAFATLFAMVAVSASVAAGCGSGGDDSVTVKTDTQAIRQSPSQAPSAAAFVGNIEKSNPGQISRLCMVRKAKGEGAAFVYFKKGYELAFPDENIPPKKVFDEIIKHCA